MKTQASVFLLNLLLAASTNCQSNQRGSNGEISEECADGPGWANGGWKAADAGEPRYTFYNRYIPIYPNIPQNSQIYPHITQYTFYHRDLTLDLDWHQLSWTHLVQRSPFTPIVSIITKYHYHIFQVAMYSDGERPCKVDK